MKKIVGFLVMAALVPLSLAADQAVNPAFSEIWAYVLSDQTATITDDLAVTDLAFFAAGISNRGELTNVPRVPTPTKGKFRKHLVLAEGDSAARTHFVLAPEFPLRDKLIQDISAALGDFDGVQIDFEQVAAYDSDNFLQFLKLLKQAIGNKTLSVALPARFRAYDEAYTYPPIAAIVDRILIMAYDEHWSGSKPGPIASTAWSAVVANYALATIGADKLILGLPCYGRIWGNRNPAGAYRFGSIDRIQKENNATLQHDDEGLPFFSFTATITYTAYFEDAGTMLQRADLYHHLSIDKIGFWRLGLEDPKLWPGLAQLDQFGPPSTTPVPVPVIDQNHPW